MPSVKEGKEEESWHYKFGNLTNFFRKALEEINYFISNWKIIIMHNNCNQETKVNQEKKKNVVNSLLYSDSLSFDR